MNKFFTALFFIVISFTPFIVQAKKGFISADIGMIVKVDKYLSTDELALNFDIGKFFSDKHALSLSIMLSGNPGIGPRHYYYFLKNTGTDIGTEVFLSIGVTTIKDPKNKENIINPMAFNLGAGLIVSQTISENFIVLVRSGIEGKRRVLVDFSSSDDDDKHAYLTFGFKYLLK